MRGPFRRLMVTWLFEDLKKLPEDLMKKSSKVCALTNNLDRSEDKEMICIKHCPCDHKEPLSHMQSKGEEDVDPFDETKNDNVTQGDAADLQIDHDEDDTET